MSANSKELVQVVFGLIMTVVKPYNCGRWTEARRRSFIMSALRRAAWPVKYEAKKLSALPDKIVNPASGRKCLAYRCADCGGAFIDKHISIDHIAPVVPVTGHDSWDGVIERLMCEIDGFQVLCHGCHKVKTEIENVERARNKKEKKDGNSK